jgi:hypothetical protein
MDKHATRHFAEEQLDWVETSKPTGIELKPDQEIVKPKIPLLEVGTTRVGKTCFLPNLIVDGEVK